MEQSNTNESSIDRRVDAVDEDQRKAHEFVSTLMSAGNTFHATYAACAGHGKTHWLITVIFVLVFHFQVPASAIVAISFTRSAARELEGRLLEKKDDKDDKDDKVLSEVKVTTMHAMCFRFICEFQKKKCSASHDEDVVCMESIIPEMLELLKENEDMRAHVKQTRVSWLFVDEAQDCNKEQMELATNVLAELWGCHVVLVGDINQSIFAFQGARPEIFDNCSKLPDWHNIVGDTNRRSTREIVEATNHVLTELQGVNMVAVKGTSAVAPSLRCFCWTKDEVDFVASRVNELVTAGVQPKEIAILSRNNNSLHPFCVALMRNHGIDVSIKCHETGKVCLTTMHSSKGCTWDHVFVTGIIDKNYSKEDKAPEARLLYVSMTRPTTELYLSYAMDKIRNPNVSRFLPRTTVDSGAVRSIVGKEGVQVAKKKRRYLHLLAATFVEHTSSSDEETDDAEQSAEAAVPPIQLERWYELKGAVTERINHMEGSKILELRRTVNSAVFWEPEETTSIAPSIPTVIVEHRLHAYYAAVMSAHYTLALRGWTNAMPLQVAQLVLLPIAWRKDDAVSVNEMVRRGWCSCHADEWDMKENFESPAFDSHFLSFCSNPITRQNAQRIQDETEKIVANLFNGNKEAYHRMRVAYGLDRVACRLRCSYLENNFNDTKTKEKIQRCCKLFVQLSRLDATAAPEESQEVRSNVAECMLLVDAMALARVSDDESDKKWRLHLREDVCDTEQHAAHCRAIYASVRRLKERRQEEEEAETASSWDRTVCLRDIALDDRGAALITSGARVYVTSSDEESNVDVPCALNFTELVSACLSAAPRLVFFDAMNAQRRSVRVDATLAGRLRELLLD